MIEKYHGGFELFPIENVMIIKAYGSWNLECAEQYVEASEKLYDQTHQDYMDLIIDLSELEGLTPEAIAKINGYNHLCKERNMFKSQAFYAPKSKLLLHMVTSFLQLTGAIQIGIKDKTRLLEYATTIIREEKVEEVIHHFCCEELSQK